MAKLLTNRNTSSTVVATTTPNNRKVVYRPPPPAPNVLTNAHPPWTADPQQASAQLGPYPGNFPVAAAAGMSWQGAGGAAPMVHGMWPTAPGILTATQRPGPVPQQTGRSRCQEWTPIEVQWLLTLKGQKMTHPKIAEFLSDMFNVERTHHMVTKKLAALRKEAVKANVYEQSINNVLPRSIDILFEELTAEMGVPFVPSKERRENLLRYLKTFFSGVILDSQKAAAGAGAMGSHHEQAQF
ncbi:hypothetical protein B0H65DRAFT_210543 [Neurospora tetraspora]|uniref:Uncharacterized protein n=1 Tax=Neurospora tetraspora TaxID=94610 RepID=A0AAE0JGC5_9PEZI|nr:hypothetical protein B0H65DRAFT_210543 [Neurospora tetraspora]